MKKDLCIFSVVLLIALIIIYVVKGFANASETINNDPSLKGILAEIAKKDWGDICQPVTKYVNDVANHTLECYGAVDDSKELLELTANQLKNFGLITWSAVRIEKDPETGKAYLSYARVRGFDFYPFKE